MPSDISRVFPYFHVGGLSTRLEKCPLLKSPNASDRLESVGILCTALCSCRIGEPPHRRKGMLSECRLHPRGCTTHSPSLPDSHIHQSCMKYENSPRRSQFLQTFDPASATCEEQRGAELWEYKISCHWCLVNQHSIPREGRLCSHVPATCRNVLSHLRGKGPLLRGTCYSPEI